MFAVLFLCVGIAHACAPTGTSTAGVLPTSCPISNQIINVAKKICECPTNMKPNAGNTACECSSDNFALNSDNNGCHCKLTGNVEPITCTCKGAIPSAGSSVCPT
ncbi:unnamed protein product [Caenorhabditis auriculariae]|uniref:Uncharacterized protein n=1 Tax=Caenorhabditis auriculariae TaxID=2777116 RepID=A0A8S1HNK7_9PELO|nr:unnamed protein product [Caenorhabditis auriculariae]